MSLPERPKPDWVGFWKHFVAASLHGLGLRVFACDKQFRRVLGCTITYTSRNAGEYLVSISFYYAYMTGQAGLSLPVGLFWL